MCVALNVIVTAGSAMIPKVAVLYVTEMFCEMKYYNHMIINLRIMFDNLPSRTPEYNNRISYYSTVPGIVFLSYPIESGKAMLTFTLNVLTS